MKHYTRVKICENGLSLIYETFSTNDILDEYFPDWMVMMARTNQPITENACISDWITLHQAWETDSQGYHVLPETDSSASGVSP
jgi:hypothetical protein